MHTEGTCECLNKQKEKILNCGIDSKMAYTKTCLYVKHTKIKCPFCQELIHRKKKSYSPKPTSKAKQFQWKPIISWLLRKSCFMNSEFKLLEHRNNFFFYAVYWLFFWFFFAKVTTCMTTESSLPNHYSYAYLQHNATLNKVIKSHHPFSLSVKFFHKNFIESVRQPITCEKKKIFLKNQNKGPELWGVHYFHWTSLNRSLQNILKGNYQNIWQFTSPVWKTLSNLIAFTIPLYIS